MHEEITQICREVPDHLRCRHIFDDGRRCGSYSLRNENFCYYHHAERKPVPDPQARHARRNSVTLPAPTSRAAIQEAIGKIIVSLASNDIDRRRAGTLLYGLQLATLNIARHREEQKPEDPKPNPATKVPPQTFACPVHRNAMCGKANTSPNHPPQNLKTRPSLKRSSHYPNPNCILSAARSPPLCSAHSPSTSK